MAKKIDVTLTVTESPLGKGNAGGGNYNYTVQPDPVHITEKDTEIKYALIEQDRAHFKMVGIYATDVHGQLLKPVVTDDSITVIHKNTRQQLTVIAIRVEDRAKGAHVSCDPEVTNDPPPVDGGG